MKVTLVPWCLNSVTKEVNIERVIPLGVLSISASLKSAGHEVLVMDYNLPENITLSQSEFADKLIDTKAMVFGFSVAAGVLHTSLAIAEYIKNKVPNSVIVFGGPHPSLVDIHILQEFSFIDFVARGEGERVLVDLLSALQDKSSLENVAGITYKRDSTIVQNKSVDYIEWLDSLPMPDYSAYPIEEIVNSFIPIEIGRGCPFNCAYCSASVIWGRKYRVKSVKRVISEIKYLKRTYNINNFYFRHDQIIKDKKWLYDLCETIIRVVPGIRWQCSARIDTITEEILTRMKEAGCTGIEYGIESGSPKIQVTIGKMLQTAEILDKLVATVKLGISPILFFMCGFPEEDIEDVRQTLSFIMKASCIIKKNGFLQLRALIPFPKTSIAIDNVRLLRFEEKRISPLTLRTYSESNTELAKKSPEIFPEFYYLENKHELEFDYFVKLEKFVIRVIQFCNLNFHYSFKWLLMYLDYDFMKFEMLWNDCTQEKWMLEDLKEVEMVSFINQFLKYLSVKFSNIPDWIFETAKYEETLYMIRMNFSDSNKTDKFIVDDSVFTLNRNVKIEKFAYSIGPILEVIENSENKLPTQVFSISEQYMLFCSISISNVFTFKLKDENVEFIKCFDGIKSLKDIFKELKQGDDKKEEFFTQVEYLIKKGILE